MQANCMMCDCQQEAAFTGHNPVPAPLPLPPTTAIAIHRTESLVTPSILQLYQCHGPAVPHKCLQLHGDWLRVATLYRMTLAVTATHVPHPTKQHPLAIQRGRPMHIGPLNSFIEFGTQGRFRCQPWTV